jgi:hypothetical protein
MRIVTIGAATALLFLSGCQTNQGAVADGIKPPASATQNSASAAEQAPEGVDTQTVTAAVPAEAVSTYVPPKPGTVLTFRNNWATLPPVIRYRIDGVVTAGESSYVKMTSTGGLKEPVSAFYDTSNYGFKGYRGPDGKPLLTYKPVEERYRFPMKAGDQWITQWKSFDHRKQAQTNGGGVVKVVGMETVEVPAGRFRAMKVRLPVARDMPAGMTHHVWFAPELGVTVKEHIGNGSLNWTQVLEKVETPGS